MLEHRQLAPLLGGRNAVDVPCPLCSPYRLAAHRKLKVLRLWRGEQPGVITYHCVHCEAAGTAWDGMSKRDRKLDQAELERRKAQRAADAARYEAWRHSAVQEIWNGTISPEGSWTGSYIASRQLILPKHCQVIRDHPNCHFPDGTDRPAMVAAFTPLLALASGVVLPPCAVHRIRGRGRNNKFMFGPVAQAAVMIDNPWEIGDELHLAEGIETALGARMIGGGPIWAVGSEGALRKFPLLSGSGAWWYGPITTAVAPGLRRPRSSAAATLRRAAKWRSTGRKRLATMADDDGPRDGEPHVMTPPSRKTTSTRCARSGRSGSRARCST